MKTLGIDFGTSNSCVAFYDGKNAPRVIVPNVEGRALIGGNIIPTVVALDKEGNLHAAGQFAQACGAAMGNTLIDRIKMWVGLSYASIEKEKGFRLQNLGYTIIKNDEGIPVVDKNGHQYSAEDLASYFFNYLVLETINSLRKEKLLDAEEQFSLIVTYPAYYSQNQVDAIRSAVNSSLRTLENSPKNDYSVSIAETRLIPEPLASVCGAMFEGKIDADDTYVLVIDEGAGTLDVMLVNMKMNPANPASGSEYNLEAGGITIGGQENLGGVDMDDAIYYWIQEELIKKDNNIQVKLLDSLEKKELMKNIEYAKISLARGNSANAHIFIPRYTQVVELTKEKLDQLVSPIVNDCGDKVLEALSQIEKKIEGFHREDISKIILIGGPTQMKLFQEKIAQILPITPIAGINPMEYVAYGASVSPDVKFKVPVERTYGLIHKSHDRENFQRIVEKDTILPVTKIIPYPIDPFADQITIEVAQIARENQVEIEARKMGSYRCLTPPNMAKGNYYILFGIDEERKIDLAIFDTKIKAENYGKGAEFAKPLMQLTFARERENEVSVIQKGTDQAPDPLLMAFYQFSRVITPRLKNALDQIQICDRILSPRFSIAEERKTLFEDLKVKIENGLQLIDSEVQNQVRSLDIEFVEPITPEIEREFRGIEQRISNMQEFRDMTISMARLQNYFDTVRNEIRYDKDEIGQLLQDISEVQTRAVMVLTKQKKQIPEKARKEINELMTSIDTKKTILVNNQDSDIFAISLEGDTFREVFIKKEELLSKISNWE